jgi:hypothetical protein
LSSWELLVEVAAPAVAKGIPKPFVNVKLRPAALCSQAFALHILLLLLHLGPGNIGKCSCSCTQNVNLMPHGGQIKALPDLIFTAC